MRPSYAVLLASLAGLGIAMGYPVQQSDTAESQFKNIVSFKGQKASDIIPAMEFMSTSLGASCDFCHEEDRSSDAKKPKQTAREMIAMQRDINQRNFNGRNQVTCATCHAGHTRPVNSPPVVGLDVRTRRSTDVNAEAVFSAYAKACNADAAKAIRGLEFRGTVTTKGVKSPLEATYSGLKFKTVIKEIKNDNLMGFNGQMGWFTTPKGIVSVPLSLCVSYIDPRTLFVGPDTLPKLSRVTGGTATISGKDNLVISGTREDGNRVSLFFDKQTNLLSRVSFSYPSILGSVVKINDYTDYRRVNGAQVPMTVTSHAPEEDFEMHFNSVKVNNSIPSSTFEAPKS